MRKRAFYSSHRGSQSSAAVPQPEDADGQVVTGNLAARQVKAPGHEEIPAHFEPDRRGDLTVSRLVGQVHVSRTVSPLSSWGGGLVRWLSAPDDAHFRLLR